ncbi:MAG: hypothetical protein ACP5N3_03495 [Candidatus Nanoarchaeia archaeon]
MKQDMNRPLNSKQGTPNTVRLEAGPTIFLSWFWETDINLKPGRRNPRL